MDMEATIREIVDGYEYRKRYNRRVLDTIYELKGKLVYLYNRKFHLDQLVDGYQQMENDGTLDSKDENIFRSCKSEQHEVETFIRRGEELLEQAEKKYNKYKFLE